jgi:hypothetical protein
MTSRHRQALMAKSLIIIVAPTGLIRTGLFLAAHEQRNKLVECCGCVVVLSLSKQTILIVKS